MHFERTSEGGACRKCFAQERASESKWYSHMLISFRGLASVNLSMLRDHVFSLRRKQTERASCRHVYVCPRIFASVFAAHFRVADDLEEITFLCQVGR
eukprot:814737-Alexandrium_andersonii.AAC.1